MLHTEYATPRDLLDRLDEIDILYAELKDDLARIHEYMRDCKRDRHEIIRELSRQGYEIDWGP